MGPHALYLHGSSRQSHGPLRQEGEQDACGRGKEGDGGVKVGVTWESSSEITQTPRQGSA